MLCRILLQAAVCDQSRNQRGKQSPPVAVEKANNVQSRYFRRRRWDNSTDAWPSGESVSRNWHAAKLDDRAL